MGNNFPLHNTGIENGFSTPVLTPNLSLRNTYRPSNAYALLIHLVSCSSKSQILSGGTSGEGVSLNWCAADPQGILIPRERPDTIRSIVANLVGDDDSGDSLVDESEPVQPLQQAEIEDYSDPQWEPEPIDAGPGECKTSN